MFKKKWLLIPILLTVMCAFWATIAAGSSSSKITEIDQEAKYLSAAKYANILTHSDIITRLEKIDVSIYRAQVWDSDPSITTYSFRSAPIDRLPPIGSTILKLAINSRVEFMGEFTVHRGMVVELNYDWILTDAI